MQEDGKPGFLEFAGIFCISASGISYEILITRCLSITLWYHFAFMVISVAMLGFGASGTFLLLNKFWNFRQGKNLPGEASILAGISMAVVFFLLTQLHPDLFQMGHNLSVLITLVLIYVLLAIPFFFVGTAVVKLLSLYPERVSLLYGFDLLGAGLGCSLVIAMTELAGLPRTIFIWAGICIIGAGFLSRHRSFRFRSIIGISLILFALLTMVADKIVIPPGSDKMLSFYSQDASSPFRFMFRGFQKQIAQDQTKYLSVEDDNWPVMETLASRWDKLCRIDASAYSDRHAIYGIGAPSEFVGTIPDQIMITQDGDAATFITHFDGDFSRLGFIDQFLYGLPYSIKRYPDVMVIGAGGGTDVLAALKYGSDSIVAVELNKGTVELVKNKFSKFSGGIYSNPRVKVIIGEGRSVVSRLKQKFDLIQMTGVDTWAASSQGAYILSENFLYTVDAFEAYFKQLKNNGILSIVRARFREPRESLRICSLALEMLEQQGVKNPGSQIAVVSESTERPNLFAGILIKNGKWTTHEIKALKRFCWRSGFNYEAGPGGPQNNPFQRLLFSQDRSVFYRTYPYDIAPVYDNSPYFFKFSRWGHIHWKNTYSSLLGINLGARPGTGHESGLGILLLILLQSLIFSFTLIILPLLKAKILLPKKSIWIVNGIFGGAGLGFMFLEMAFIHRMTLFLGYPSRSLSVTLYAMLTGAGIGSMLSQKYIHRAVQVIRTSALVSGIIALLSAFFLPWLLQSMWGLPELLRMGLAFVLISSLSISMGFIIPLSLYHVSKQGHSLAIWGWSINAFFSVIGSVLATVISMSSGFTAVFIAAFISYGAIWFSMFWLGRSCCQAK